jgi:phospholipid N-methyltransferase
MSISQLQRHTADDFGRFLKSWIQNPLAVGAVAPSGRLLAKLMATDLHRGARVLELGAGTGTLTAAILGSGVAPEDLTLVERDSEFVQILRRRFAACEVLQGDATALDALIGERAGTFDFVVSGLPLLLFSPEQKRALLARARDALRPGGCLHQFTYAGRCPIGRDLRRSLGLEASLLGVAAFNLPPAFVYRLRKV